MIVAEDLDRRVLDALTGRFGWCPRYTITNNLTPGHAGEGEKDLDASIERLEKSKQLQVMRRPGNSDLFRIPPAPGEEATAPVRPDPIVPGDKKIVKFTGDVVSTAQVPREPAPRATEPRVRDPYAVPVVRKKTSPPAAPVAPMQKESLMPTPHQTRRTREQIDAAIFKALAHGPLSNQDLEQRTKIKGPTLRRAMLALQKDKKVTRGEGRFGAWALLNGAASAGVTRTAPAASAGSGSGGNAGAGTVAKVTTPKNGDGITELELKLIVIDTVQKQIKDQLLRFGLMQIRIDLERLGAR